MKAMKKFMSLFLAAAMTVSLAACGGGSDNASSGSGDAGGSQGGSGDAQTSVTAQSASEVEGNTSEPQYGGEVTIYYPKFYDVFDPAMSNEYQYSFWYETLFTIDWAKAGEYDFGPAETPIAYMKGQIAQDTGEFDQEAGTLTVKIRDDVYFQDGSLYDGRQLTADDVVWSYSRMLGLNGMEKVEAEDAMAFIDADKNLYMIENVEATDDNTVVFTFKKDFANEVAYQKFLNVKINIAGEEWDSLSQEEKNDWHNAQGTGPYILADYKADNSMKLVRNDNYYGTDEKYPENKLPYIDTINLVYIADASNILAQAMSGDLQWFGENGKNVLSVEQLATLSDANAGYEYVYNSSTPVAIGFKTNQSPFDDINVRIALQHAINIAGISEAFLGVPQDQVVIPGLWSPDLSEWTTIGTWDDETTSEYTYDVALAKQMLEDAGYPDGFEFTIQLDPTANQDIFTEAKTELAQVGVTMNIEVASEMMEAVSVSQDPEDERMFNAMYGSYGAFDLANMMIGDNSAMLDETNSYVTDDQEVFDLLATMQQAETIADQTDAANQLDQLFAKAHWGIYLTGVQPCTDWMSNTIGGYSGQKVYYDQNMRTIWARLWVDGAGGTAPAASGDAQ